MALLSQWKLTRPKDTETTTARLPMITATGLRATARPCLKSETDPVKGPQNSRPNPEMDKKALRNPSGRKRICTQCNGRFVRNGRNRRGQTDGNGNWDVDRTVNTHVEKTLVPELCCINSNVFKRFLKEKSRTQSLSQPLHSHSSILSVPNIGPAVLCVHVT